MPAERQQTRGRPDVTPATFDGARSGPERLRHIQRGRIIAALAAVVAERGASGTTVEQIAKRSGVSRRTFYESFRDVEDCLLAAFDEGVASIAGEVVVAYEQAADERHGTAVWSAAIRAGLIAALAHLESAPEMARLLFVESWGSRPALIERRRGVLDQLYAAVDGGRHAKRGAVPGPLTAECVVGAVLAVVHGRVLDSEPTGGEPGELLALTSPLMSMIVLPYLGAGAARRELERPAPRASGRPRARQDNPLSALDMRLTYRTVRVLTAVAVKPGFSNRQLAREAGISDQGQMSKLLGRLKRIGLIDNAPRRPLSGEANKWTLTDRGRELYDVVGGLDGREP
jgi:AcrR family transcriptional regulator